VGYSPKPDDVSTGTWGTKFPWFRLRAGTLRVTGTRLDGVGTFTADLSHAASYAVPGVLPSNLYFSTGGCWRVTGRLGSARVVLYIHIDRSRAAICASLAHDAADIREINSPANEPLARLDAAALGAHGCPTPPT
jgi:hypothetical protein